MDGPDGSYNDEYMADGAEAAEGSNVQQQQQQHRPPSSPANSSVSLHSQSYKGRTRTTVVCAECKRLKLGCDRQRPCGKCVLRDTTAKCVYDPTADGKIDVHSVHRAQLSDRNLLLGIADTIGISEEERGIVGANGWPPSDGFKFTIDPTRIRNMLGMDYSENHTQASSGLGGRSFTPDSIPLVAFSKPPTQVIIPNPLAARFGHAPRPTPPGRRLRPTHQEDPIHSSSDVQKMLTLASRAFQANSITIPTQSTSHLQQNSSSLGWEAQVAYRSAAPIPSVADLPSTSKADRKEPARNIFRMAPRHSEIDFHDAPRPKDTLVMSLAYRLFVMPGLSSENSPPMSQQTPLLVTPQQVKQYLPSLPWRSRLWDEFESLMVIHDGMGGSGRITWLRKRIDRMFEWADLAVDADPRGPSQDGAGDSWSTYTPSSLSSGTRSSSSRPGQSTTSRSRTGRDTNEISPPTLALFAVASAVFSLGVLNYECRKAHEAAADNVPMDTTGGGDSLPSGGQAMPPPTLTPLPVSDESSYSVLRAEIPSAIPPNQNPWRPRDPAVPQSARSDPHQFSETPNSHTLHSLARACLFAHNALDLPPSLDYLYAHTLNWTFLLHPSTSLSRTNDGGDGIAHGITGGTIYQVEPSIWKELGSCVNVARTMGLGIVDEVASGSFGQVGREHEEDVEDDGMSLWEREMRRRVWWTLVVFDLKISEYLGHPPLIALNPSSCKPPSNVDDSRFDPTSTVLPLTTPGGASTTFFVLKCRLAILMAFQNQQTFRDSRTGNLSKVAAQSFASRVVAWLDELPEEFKLNFGETAEETNFPESDVIAAQACDLHIQAHLMVIRLWHPFLVDAFGYPSLPESQNILVSSATSAKAIIVASQHVLQRFKKTRPLAFGHYGFGRAVYLAGTLLCNMLVAAPNVMFAPTAKTSIDTAITILDDPVLAGISNANGGFPSEEATTIRLLLNQAKMCQERLKPSASGKRKVELVTHVQPIRSGRPALFAGLDAASVLGCLEFGLPPIRAAPSAFPTNIASHLTDLTLDEMTSPRTKHPQVARRDSQASPAPAPPTSETHPTLLTAASTPPLPATTPSTRKPISRAASVASLVAASQLSQQSRSQTGTSPEDTASRGKPIIGVRSRMKATRSQGGSRLSSKSNPSDAPSDSKRPKQVGRSPSTAPSASNDGSLQTASPLVSPSLIAYQPPPLQGSPQAQPTIERNAAPLPTYAQPPGHLSHPQESSAPGTPHMHQGNYPSGSATYYSAGQPSLDLSTPPAGIGNGGPSDLDMVSQEQPAFNNPIPPSAPSGFTTHQLQQQEMSHSYDPMTGTIMHQVLVGTAYDRSMDPSHAMSLGNSTQVTYGIPVNEMHQALPLHASIPQQQYAQSPQQVQGHAQQMAMDHQVQPSHYVAPQRTMQEQQLSQPTMYAPQYPMAQHTYQDTTPYGGGSIIQQEWVAGDSQPTESGASHTQHVPRPPPWPNQQYPPPGNY